MIHGVCSGKGIEGNGIRLINVLPKNSPGGTEDTHGISQTGQPMLREGFEQDTRSEHYRYTNLLGISVSKYGEKDKPNALKQRYSQ